MKKWKHIKTGQVAELEDHQVMISTWEELTETVKEEVVKAPRKPRVKKVVKDE